MQAKYLVANCNEIPIFNVCTTGRGIAEIGKVVCDADGGFGWKTGKNYFQKKCSLLPRWEFKLREGMIGSRNREVKMQNEEGGEAAGRRPVFAALRRGKRAGWWISGFMDGWMRESL